MPKKISGYISKNLYRWYWLMAMLMIAGAILLAFTPERDTATYFGVTGVIFFLFYMDEKPKAQQFNLLVGAPPTTSGAERIREERMRHIHEEGYTPARDQRYAEGELAQAAATYLVNHDPHMPPLPQVSHLYFWPWNPLLYKPTGDRIEDLVKAGSLIAAEIDRLEAERA